MSFFDSLVAAGVATALAAVLTWGSGPHWLTVVLGRPLSWVLSAALALLRPQWDGSRSSRVLWNVSLVLLGVGGAGQLLQRL